jgi:multicomponent Na+:H+ antiporter subunit D
VDIAVNWLDFGGGRLELYFACVLGLVGLATLLYSLARVRGSAGQQAEYYLFALVLVGSGLGVVYARNLLLVFALWELAAFALWRLVAFFRGDEEIGAAAWAWLVNFASAAMMLLGLALIQAECGTLSFDSLRGQSIGLWPAMLVFTGILAKSATLPLYVWLPRAYKAAPAPVCALLSGVAENIGVVLFFKLFILTVQLPPGFLGFVAVLGVVSSLVAGGVALTAGTLRTILAYSTVGQLGFVFLGLSLTGYFGITGGLLYVAAHAVAKAGLFFSAGVVEDATGTGELDQLGGLLRQSPALGAGAAMLALSVTGIPPMLGFFAKLGVLIEAVRHDLLLGVGAIGAALFTVLYLTRWYGRTFLGQVVRPAVKVSRLGTAVVLLMAVVSLACGALYFLPVGFIESAMTAVLGAR